MPAEVPLHSVYRGLFKIWSLFYVGPAWQALAARSPGWSQKPCPSRGQPDSKALLLQAPRTPVKVVTMSYACSGTPHPLEGKHPLQRRRSPFRLRHLPQGLWYPQGSQGLSHSLRLQAHHPASAGALLSAELSCPRASGAGLQTIRASRPHAPPVSASWGLC